MIDTFRNRTKLLFLLYPLSVLQSLACYFEDKGRSYLKVCAGNNSVNFGPPYIILSPDAGPGPVPILALIPRCPQGDCDDCVNSSDNHQSLTGNEK